MTSPNGVVPPGSAQTGSSNASGMSSFAAKTGDQWKSEATNQVGSKYQGPGGFLGRLISFLFGGFATGIAGFISALFGGLTGTSGGGFGDLLGWLTGVGAKAEDATTTATDAIETAQSADRKVTALLNGGIRTVYTSNFTYTPPANLIKLGVILIGGGGSGINTANAGVSGTQPPPGDGGYGGGYAYYEWTAGQLGTNPIAGMVAAGRPGGTVNLNRNPNQSTFGTNGQFGISPVSNVGAAGDFRGFGNLDPSKPGNGGRGGAYAGGTSTYTGSAGDSTTLAAGGAGGTGGSMQGKNGSNAATDGQTLCGGGGGGGGGYYNAFSTDARADGGAGGFPGGAGGGGGKTYTTGGYGGPGSPGMIALIEFLQ